MTRRPAGRTKWARYRGDETGHHKSGGNAMAEISAATDHAERPFCERTVDLNTSLSGLHGMALFTPENRTPTDDLKTTAKPCLRQRELCSMLPPSRWRAGASLLPTVPRHRPRHAHCARYALHRPPHGSRGVGGGTHPRCRGVVGTGVSPGRRPPGAPARRHRVRWPPTPLLSPPGPIVRPAASRRQVECGAAVQTIISRFPCRGQVSPSHHVYRADAFAAFRACDGGRRTGVFG